MSLLIEDTSTWASVETEWVFFLSVRTLFVMSAMDRPTDHDRWPRFFTISNALGAQKRYVLYFNAKEQTLEKHQGNMPLLSHFLIASNSLYLYKFLQHHLCVLIRLIQLQINPSLGVVLIHVSTCLTAVWWWQILMPSPASRWSSARCCSSQQLQDTNTDELNHVCQSQTREWKRHTRWAGGAAFLVTSARFRAKQIKLRWSHERTTGEGGAGWDNTAA